jgi:hypothetical protein
MDRFETEGPEVEPFALDDLHDVVPSHERAEPARYYDPRPPAEQAK